MCPYKGCIICIVALGSCWPLLGGAGLGSWYGLLASYRYAWIIDRAWLCCNLLACCGHINLGQSWTKSCIPHLYTTMLKRYYSAACFWIWLTQYSLLIYLHVITYIYIYFVYTRTATSVYIYIYEKQNISIYIIYIKRCNVMKTNI